MSIELVPGTLCVYGDRVVQIDVMDSLAHATVRDTANGNIVLAPISKLRALPAKAKNAEIG
jgi:hypothetical protein